MYPFINTNSLYRKAFICDLHLVKAVSQNSVLLSITSENLTLGSHKSFVIKTHKKLNCSHLLSTKLAIVTLKISQKDKNAIKTVLSLLEAPRKFFRRGGAKPFYTW